MGREKSMEHGTTTSEIGILQAAWTRGTSFDPERWTPENPSWGQCAVTALVINDLFGGELPMARR